MSEHEVLTLNYHCGCSATGGPNLPTYCPDHCVPSVDPEWQPIETAPKDGTPVIGFDPVRESEWPLMHGVEFMRWLDGMWLDPATHTMRPTHWMRLPEPPK